MKENGEMKRKREVESGYAGLNGVMGSWNLELKGRLRQSASEGVCAVCSLYDTAEALPLAHVKYTWVLYIFLGDGT